MRRDALAAGLVAVCLWGLAPVATRAAVGHLSPLPLLLIRLSLASLVLLPWAWPVFRRLRRRSAGRLVAAGLLGLVGYNLPVTAGLRYLPASTAGLLLATEPVWVLVLGRLFLGERGGVRAWVGSAAALAGVVVLAGPGSVSGAGGGYRALAGTGLVLAATLSFAAYTIVLRPLSQELGPVPATAAATVVGSVPYLAAAGMLPGAGLAHLGPTVWAELAFLALGCTAAGLLLWSVAVMAGNITRVSMLLYLEPAVSVLGAAVFLGERVSLVMIGGGLMIMAGVAIASIRRDHGVSKENEPWPPPSPPLQGEEMTVELVRASPGDKAVFRRLLQLYHYDFSEWNGDDVDEHGEFGHRYLDHYWTDQDSHPFLIRHANRWAGFALVRTEGVNDMSEFFVMRKYRRGGVGRDAARRVFALFPGAWQVRQLHGNDAATAFWRSVVPSGYEETVTEEGPVQRFTI